jgi:hypothetical protein
MIRWTKRRFILLLCNNHSVMCPDSAQNSLSEGLISREIMFGVEEQ